MRSVDRIGWADVIAPTTRTPILSHTMCTVVVLPIPGGPEISTAFFRVSPPPPPPRPPLPPLPPAPGTIPPSAVHDDSQSCNPPQASRALLRGASANRANGGAQESRFLQLLVMCGVPHQIVLLARFVPADRSIPTARAHTHQDEVGWKRTKGPRGRKRNRSIRGRLSDR